MMRQVDGDNLLLHVGKVETLEECRMLCYDTEGCNYLSYFYPDGYPLREVDHKIIKILTSYSTLDLFSLRVMQEANSM